VTRAVAPARRSAALLAALALTALVIGACGRPEPPNVVDQRIQLDLDNGAPVAVRDIGIDVDSDDREDTTFVEVRVVVEVAGVRLVLVPDVGSPVLSSPFLDGAEASIDTYGCKRSCTLRLVAELTDPGVEAVTIDVALSVRSFRATTVSVTDPGPSGVHRLVVEGETSGEEVLDPEHPVAQLRLTASFEPGTLPPGRRFVGDAWLILEGVDPATAPAWIDTGPQGRSTAPYGDGIGVELGVVHCIAPEPCSAEFVANLAATRLLEQSTRVRWRFVSRLIDYAGDSAPSDQTVDVAAAITRVRPDARSIGQRISGTMRMTTGDRSPDASFLISPNSSLMALTADGRVQLVRTSILTMTAVEGTGPRIRDQAINHHGFHFDADGQPHTARENHVISCLKETQTCWPMGDVIEPSIGADDAALMSPITIDWSLEIRLMVLGDVDLPADADFELLPAN
jgi:hypothetical protein